MEVEGLKESLATGAGSGKKNAPARLAGEGRSAHGEGRYKLPDKIKPGGLFPALPKAG